MAEHSREKEPLAQPSTLAAVIIAALFVCFLAGLLFGLGVEREEWWQAGFGGFLFFVAGSVASVCVGGLFAPHIGSCVEPRDEDRA